MAKAKKKKNESGKKEEKVSRVALWEWTTMIVVASILVGAFTYFYIQDLIIRMAVNGKVSVGTVSYFLLYVIVIQVCAMFLFSVWKESRGNKGDRELLGHLDFIFKYVRRIQSTLQQLGDTHEYENPDTIEWCGAVMRRSLEFAKKVRLDHQAAAEVVDGLNAQLLELRVSLERANGECLRLQQESTESLTKQQSELQRRDQLAQQQISKLNAECARRVSDLREEISSLEESLQIAQAAERNATASAGLDIDKLRTEIADLRSQLDRLREEHTVALSEKDHSHEQTVVELNQAHAQQVELLEQRIVALQAELEEARDEVIRVDDLNSVVSAEVKQLQQQVEAMTADHRSKVG